MRDPEEILEEIPGSVVFARYAEQLMGEGRYNEAMMVLQRGVKRHPNYAPGHSVMASLLAVMKSYDQAMVEWGKSIELDPQSPRDLLSYGERLMRAGRSGDASDILMCAAMFEPFNEEITSLLDTALADEGGREGAPADPAPATEQFTKSEDMAVDSIPDGGGDVSTKESGGPGPGNVGFGPVEYDRDDAPTRQIKAYSDDDHPIGEPLLDTFAPDAIVEEPSEAEGVSDTDSGDETTDAAEDTGYEQSDEESDFASLIAAFGGDEDNDEDVTVAEPADAVDVESDTVNEGDDYLEDLLDGIGEATGEERQSILSPDEGNSDGASVYDEIEDEGASLIESLEDMPDASLPEDGERYPDDGTLPGDRDVDLPGLGDMLETGEEPDVPFAPGDATVPGELSLDDVLGPGDEPAADTGLDFDYESLLGAFGGEDDSGDDDEKRAAETIGDLATDAADDDNSDDSGDGPIPGAAERGDSGAGTPETGEEDVAPVDNTEDSLGGLPSVEEQEVGETRMNGRPDTGYDEDVHPHEGIGDTGATEMDDEADDAVSEIPGDAERDEDGGKGWKPDDGMLDDLLGVYGPGKVDAEDWSDVTDAEERSGDDETDAHPGQDAGDDGMTEKTGWLDGLDDASPDDDADIENAPDEGSDDDNGHPADGSAGDDDLYRIVYDEDDSLDIDDDEADFASLLESFGGTVSTDVREGPADENDTAPAAGDDGTPDYEDEPVLSDEERAELLAYELGAKDGEAGDIDDEETRQVASGDDDEFAGSSGSALVEEIDDEDLPGGESLISDVGGWNDEEESGEISEAGLIGQSDEADGDDVFALLSSEEEETIVAGVDGDDGTGDGDLSADSREGIDYSDVIERLSRESAMDDDDDDIAFQRLVEQEEGEYRTAFDDGAPESDNDAVDEDVSEPEVNYDDSAAAGPVDDATDGFAAAGLSAGIADDEEGRRADGAAEEPGADVDDSGTTGPESDEYRVVEDMILNAATIGEYQDSDVEVTGIVDETVTDDAEDGSLDDLLSTYIHTLHDVPADVPDIMTSGQESPATGDDTVVVKTAPDAGDESTETMAKIFLAQGLLVQARDIYERLVERNPGNELYRQRLADIESQLDNNREDE